MAICFIFVKILVMSNANNIMDGNKMSDLKKAILETIAFFDMFDYPLTAFEIWQWLGLKCELREAIAALSRGGLAEAIDEGNGFYFLTGRQEILSVRQRRHNYAQRKTKRAGRVAGIFRSIPWIKFIAVGNIIGAHNLKDESDIDFFIVTEGKRVWLTRLFCAGLMKVLGRRPTAHEQRDRVCLNFYVSEERLDLRNLRMPDEDIYFVYWLVCLVPVYDQGGVYEKLITANAWLKKKLPNWQPANIPEGKRAGRRWPKFYHLITGLLFGGLENAARGFESRIMPREMKEMMNKDTRVVVNDEVIKLHVKDRRKEYSEKHRNRLSAINGL